MEQLIELFFERVLPEFLGEGERRFKREALSAALAAVHGTRRLVLLIYLVIFFGFLSALSFFALAFTVFDQWKLGAWSWSEPKLLFSALLFAVSSACLALTVRKRSWSAAFRIEQALRDLERKKSESSSAEYYSEAQIVAIVEKVMDRRESDRPRRKRRAPSVSKADVG